MSVAKRWISSLRRGDPCIRSTLPGWTLTWGLGQRLFSTRFIDSEMWAEDTGGKAYHANEIKQEIADAVDHGSRYYMLAYVPSDGTEEGRERKVEVKVLSGKYTMFYRKHYFEQTQKEITTTSVTPAKSPLLPLMGHG